MFQKETYINRRKKLCQKISDGLMLFIGNREQPFNYPDNTFPFRQDSTFLYLFGIDMPNVSAIIDPADGTATIYADEATIDDIIWTGPLPTVAEIAAQAGITQVKPYARLQTDIANAASKKIRVHYIRPYAANVQLEIAQYLSITPAEVPARASEDLTRALIAMRSVKEQCEIDELERHMAFGRNMHLAAMRMAQEGMTETDVKAAIEYEALKGGGQVSFPTICTVRGETLHNHVANRMLRNGDLLLVDAGCESPLHYATDNTRTTPVGGKFTAQQREIYQIVLDANNAVAAAIRPNVKYVDIHKLAARTIADGLAQLGIMKGDIDEAVEQGAHALFFPHGIGHMLGLDVHDMENYGETLVGYDDEVSRSSQFGLASLRLGRRLQTGFVVTNEPGIYFIPALIDKWQAEKLHTDFICYEKLTAYRNFGGIRLEDDIVVTDTAARILGQRIPIEIAGVERVASGKTIE